MASLYYIIGASGAGKDSLMNYARAAINGSHPVIFANRYITRPLGTGNENHISLSPEEFKCRLEGGLFALDWGSHRQLYAIGKEIDEYRNKGFTVAVNGSREYLATAREKYSELKVVMIEASPELIRRRLLDRGRESPADIEGRIARNLALSRPAGPLIRIGNDGSLAEAGEKLVSVLIGS
ncbi:MAG: phosphonate metabolism protein/1,5-bisphosphokinase (PRPP-forming) PhnN [Puia sp.]|nr:phosphonate metabolism protein/1,5-bisphosphokinase (PRPP-forming) PhnN [Puia sp.]